jgi:hypothetical protein
MYLENNQQPRQQQQQEQGLLGLRNSSDNNYHNDHIAYRNFIHSIKSERTKAQYIKYLNLYMNWLDVDFDGF